MKYAKRKNGRRIKKFMRHHKNATLHTHVKKKKTEHQTQR